MSSQPLKGIQKLQDQDYKSTSKTGSIPSKISGTLLLKFVKLFSMNTESFTLMMILLWEATFLKNLSVSTKSVLTVVDQITCTLMSFTQQISLLKFGLSQESSIWKKNISLLAKAFHKIQTNKSKWK